MCLLIESIKIKNGRFFNMHYHNRRMNDSRKALWNCGREIDLSKELTVPPGLTGQFVKCRVLYDRDIRKVEFTPYSLPVIKRLKLVCCDHIDYGCKYADRSRIQELYEKRYPYDDVLIVKNGFLTDTSFCNIVLQKDGTCFTPSTCLLNGTKRRQLLHDGKIIEKEIDITALRHFETISLINAMIDLEDGVAVPVNEVYE